MRSEKFRKADFLISTRKGSRKLIVVQDLGMFSPKFLRERRKSFVHRVFSIRSITLGHGKVLAFI